MWVKSVYRRCIDYNKKNSMKKFVTKKRHWVLALLLIAAAGSWFVFQDDGSLSPNIETGLVERSDVVEIVSETGFAQAAQAVEMAFERGGRVVDVLVQEGDEVLAGDVLLRLNAAAAAAELASAQARLEAEQVRLQELLAGADTNSLAVSQSSVVSAETALTNARRNLNEVTAQQNQLVTNAKKTLRTTGLQAYLTSDERDNTDESYESPVVSGVYDSEEDGVYRIELYNSGAPSGSSYRVSGLESATESVSTFSPTPIGSRGLFLQFPDNFESRTEWEIPVPNTRSATYLTNLNAYNAAVEGRNVAIAAAENAVQSAQAAVTQGKSQYTQVSSSARTEKIAAQQALVNQMRANLQSVQVAYENLTLTAPFDGVVTKVHTEVGQIVSVSAPAVSIISQGQYELTVSISEVDIAEISPGDTAQVRFDAYDDEFFTAHVERISPNAQLIDGVRVFEVTLVFDDTDEKIRDGLSADIDITTAVKENVVAVQTRSIYEDELGKFVRTVGAEDSVQIVRIETGLRGSDGKTEVTSGLVGGERIITFANEDDLDRLEN